MRSLSLGLLMALAPAAAAQRAVLSDADVRATVDHVAEAVIVPTYLDFEHAAARLREAVEDLASEPSAAALDAAREAWRQARTPWEQAEAFLFGPVDLGLYDPALDTWPLNVVDLEGLLASDVPLRADALGTLPGGIRGFHAIEYLLWGVAGTRTADSLSAREVAYLQLVADDMARSAADLHADWAQPGGYADVLRAAGGDGAVYETLDDALYELLMGVLFIVDEVQAEKLGVPLDSEMGMFAESRFSGASADDVRNNLLSVLHVYSGDVGEAEGPGLDVLVATVDPALDERFRREIGAALAAVDALPGPLRDAVVSAPDAVERALVAVQALQRTLEDDLIYRLTQ